MGEPLLLTYSSDTQTLGERYRRPRTPPSTLASGSRTSTGRRPAHRARRSRSSGQSPTGASRSREAAVPDEGRHADAARRESSGSGCRARASSTRAASSSASTKPITITVDPLPDAPGFSGAVGRFTPTASLDRETVPLGEAATLRFRVEGTGNLKWIDQAPEVQVRGRQGLSAAGEERPADDGRTASSGSRTWEFVVVPETSGPVEVPALSFSYFEPSAGGGSSRRRRSRSPCAWKEARRRPVRAAPPLAGVPRRGRGRPASADRPRRRPGWPRRSSAAAPWPSWSGWRSCSTRGSGARHRLRGPAARRGTPRLPGPVRPRSRPGPTRGGGSARSRRPPCREGAPSRPSARCRGQDDGERARAVRASSTRCTSSATRRSSATTRRRSRPWPPARREVVRRWA